MKTKSNREVTASEAKLHFGEVLNQCVYGSEPIIITKHDKPVAVLVKMEEWKNKKNPEENNVPEFHKKLMARKAAYQKWAKENNIKPGPSAVKLTRQGRKELDERSEKWKR